MRGRRGAIRILACGLLGFCRLAEGGEERVLPGREEIARETARLGDDELQAREEATSRLLEWGRADPRTVLALLSGDPNDPEAMSRCADIGRRVFDEWFRHEAFAIAGKEPVFRDSVRRLAGGVFAAESVARFERGAPRAGGRADAVLELLLWNPEAPARKEAVLHFREGRSEGAGRRIRELLSDRDASVRAAAALVLGGPDCGPERIREGFEDPDPRLRALALGAMPPADGKVDAERILGSLEDLDRSVRLAAIGAARRLKTVEAAPALSRLLSSDDPGLRLEAARAMLQIAGEQADPAAGEVESALAWWERHRSDPEFAGRSGLAPRRPR